MTAELLFGEPKYRDGFAAWVGLAVVFLTSIEKLRRAKYHVFYALHFSFLAFYIFAWNHTESFRFYGWWAMAIYGSDKLLRIVRGVLSTKRVTRIERVPNTDILRVTIPKPWWARPQLGQYVFLNFPGVSRSPFEWHPYTLASSPLEPTYEVDIKNLGDHTAKLLANFQTGATPLVRVDGPYGRVVINPRRYSSLVFVCGGIGVTPMISMLRWYFLLNAPADVAAKQSVHLAQYVYLLWVVDARRTYDVFRDTVAKCVARSQEKGFPTFVPLIHLTRDEAADGAALGLPSTSVFRGRPDMKHVLGSVKSNGAAMHAVYCCGPKQLVDQTWDATTALTDAQARFNFHHETFEF